MGEMRIMTSEGDVKVIWDKDKDVESIGLHCRLF